MPELNKKQKIIAIIFIIIIVITIVIYAYKTFNNKDETNINDEYDQLYEENITDITNEEIEKLEIIKVHVEGEVNSPGIISLNEGDRIADAIEKAGGAKESADISQLNLAYIMQDGEKLYVPSKQENTETEETKVYVTTESGKNIITSGTNTNKTIKKVNINTASKEELITLSGIGESTADKIIAYREETGKFSKIEDIKNVPGIGDAKFETIKENIKVK